jgi:hypothetical protein
MDVNELIKTPNIIIEALPREEPGEQLIFVRLKLQPGQARYQILEHGYRALQHFFEDAGFVVTEIKL